MNTTMGVYSENGKLVSAPESFDAIIWAHNFIDKLLPLEILWISTLYDDRLKRFE